MIFTYPVDGQRDVPDGARIVVAFSEPVVATALGSFHVDGPSGPIAATPAVGADGKTVTIDAPALDAGASYQLFVGQALCPTAQNLPASGPLLSFTARNDRPRSAAPTLIAINGTDAAGLDAHPLFDTSTIRLVFSEPLDPRRVALEPGSIQLLDGNGAVVPATLLAHGIHVSIDPDDALAAAEYRVEIGAGVVDLGGQAVTPQTIRFTPKATAGKGPYPQVLRTRVAGDPGAKASRTGAMPNAIAISHALIGSNTSTLHPSTLATSLADPTALAGPIAFSLPRGQRLSASGLDIALGGVVPAGVSTGDIEIELLTDAGGVMYRNPYQAAEQTPDNDRAPLFVALDMDIAVFAKDPKGNAVMAQTILGVHGVGIVTATEGVLDIETVTAMDLGLLGVTSAPSNMVLELITDSTAQVQADTTPPTLTATFPDAGSELLPVDGGIELIFDEAIDMSRARFGGIVLRDANGVPVDTVIESHGSAVVVRPLSSLPYSSDYTVELTDIADLSGNRANARPTIAMSTPKLASTGVPLAIASSHPGAPCALGSSGRCAGAQSTDDAYQAFALAANQPITVTFTQPIHAASIALGTQCNAGTVRVEEVDDSGACTGVVAGTLVRRDRQLAFFPDAPWTLGKHYRLGLISGGNQSCGAGVLCGLVSAASFDPLNGTTGSDGGGANAMFPFTGAPPSAATFLVDQPFPATDSNGSGFVDGGEVTRDENRAALKIIGHGGSVSGATFNSPDCIPETPEREACVYLAGAMPVELEPVQQNCALPDGTTVASCMPVAMSTHAMYGTSIRMTATVLVDITTDTGTQLMRVREPAGGGSAYGYLYVDNGTPSMITALDVYMDAPDMSLPLGTSHDLHSKPLHMILKGPVSTLEDGRVAIALRNTEDVPVTVNIDAPIVGAGAINMIMPAGEMRLQLVGPALRGRPL